MDPKSESPGQVRESRKHPLPRPAALLNAT